MGLEHTYTLKYYLMVVPESESRDVRAHSEVLRGGKLATGVPR